MIEPLDLTDGPTVVAALAVQRAAYAVEAQLLGTDAIPALHEDATAFAASGETMLGLRESGELLGFVAYVRTAATVDVHRLVVSPAAFRRGVATRLLDALDAAEPDAARIVVSTGAANAPALALYGRRGFVRTGARIVSGDVEIADLERRHDLPAT